MKNNETYIRQANKVTGNQTVFTAIEIQATPEVVRAKFLDFEKWPEWNVVIPGISIKRGDINNLASKPTLDLILDFGRKGDPARAPINPRVTENSKEVFNWGFNLGILKAEHVFIFESINSGKGTRLVHYEKMGGILKSFIMNKEVKANMIDHYNKMNEALKKLCEAHK